MPSTPIDTRESEARLRASVAAELKAPVLAAVRAVAAEIAARGGGVAGVLFYGSALRAGGVDGLLDFYVLLERLEGWDWSAAARSGAALLPPNVEYFESLQAGQTIRAKIAVMTLDQFSRHARAASLDTTIWTRFAQPAALVHARDEAAFDAVVAGVAEAVKGAAWWAAHLGPERAAAAAYWTGLFERTYASELRVESAARPAQIVERAPDRYAAMLELGLAAAGVAVARTEDGALAPAIAPEARRRAERGWTWRRRFAKPLNMARLAKALFTFSGGVDYLAWKIERHSGHRHEITPFQRRHPLLAAGPVMWRLWRKGVLR